MGTGRTSPRRFLFLRMWSGKWSKLPSVGRPEEGRFPGIFVQDLFLFDYSCKASVVHVHNDADDELGLGILRLPFAWASCVLKFLTFPLLPQDEELPRCGRSALQVHPPLRPHVQTSMSSRHGKVPRFTSFSETSCWWPPLTPFFCMADSFSRSVGLVSPGRRAGKDRGFSGHG